MVDLKSKHRISCKDDVFNDYVKDAFLNNIKLENGIPEVVVFVTNRGQDKKCFIKGRELSIIGTDETPNLCEEYLEEEIEFVQGGMNNEKY